MTLQQLLTLLALVSSALADSGSGKIADGAEAAEYFLKIAQAASAAYLAQVGKPINPSLLHQEEPIPEPTPIIDRPVE